MMWNTRFHRAKHSLGKAYNTSMNLVSMAVRAHTLLSKGYNVIQDRLEPEVQQQVGGALQTYSRRSKQLATVDTNARNVAGALKEAIFVDPEYLS